MVSYQTMTDTIHLTTPFYSTSLLEGPASRAQKRLLADIERFQSNLQVYNSIHYFTIEGRLDKKRLEQAIYNTLKDYDALRTVFRNEDELIQEIVSFTEVQPFFICKEIVSFEDIPAILEKQQSLVFPIWKQTSSILPVHFLYLTSIQQKNQSILLMTIHHICFDDASKFLILDKINSYYNHSEQISSPSPFRYLDFCLFEQSIEMFHPYEKGLVFWTNQVQTFTPITLPCDYNSSLLKSGKGSIIRYRLSNQQLNTLRLLRKQLRCTTFDLFIFLFSWVLNVWTYQEHIWIPTLTNQRYREELKSIVGYFPNTLLYSLHFEHNKTPMELIQPILESIRLHQKYNYVPIELVLSSIPAIKEGFSIFECMFNYNTNSNIDIYNSFQWDHYVGTLSSSITTCRSSLSFIQVHEGKEIELRFIYAIDRFEHSSIQAVLDRFVYSLDVLPNSLQHPLETVRLLLPRESKLWEQVNQTGIDDCLSFIPFIQFIYDNQRQTPSKVAIRFHSQQLTYKEFWNQIVQVGSFLSQYQRSIIVQIMSRSIEQIVGMFAIWYSGNAYMPIHAEEPIQRIQNQLNTVSPLLLTHKTQILLTQQLTATIHYIEDILTSDIVVMPYTVPQEDDMAYMATTSGSSGVPKIVCISYDALFHLVWNLKEDPYNWTSLDRILQVCECTYGPHVREILGALCIGGELILLPDKGNLDMDLFTMSILNFQVTRMYMVPSVCKLMLEYLVSTNTFHRLKGLQYFALGGEELPSSLVQEIQSHLPSLCLFNYYGTAELAIHSTIYPIPSILNDTSRQIPIGRPRRHLTATIINAEKNICFINQIGQLVFEGKYISKGYLSHPSHSFETLSNGNVRYYTGDLASLDHNGNIIYHGRNDSQVKLNGQRIELTSIEQQLRTLAVVKDCTVCVVNDQLTAFVCPRTSTPLFPSTIQKECSKLVPKYMIPSIVHIVDTLPLNRNGKLDRVSLSQFQLTTEPSTHPILNANGSTVEQSVLTIWHDLFPREYVDIDKDDITSYFGQQSIKLIRFINRIRAQYQIHLSIFDILGCSTLKEICQIIETCSVEE